MRHSTRLAVGPVQFRIGSDWAGPVAALDRLYADYPRDDRRPADATVRLFAARPWRRWLRPSVHIGGDFVVPDAAGRHHAESLGQRLGDQFLRGQAKATAGFHQGKGEFTRAMIGTVDDSGAGQPVRVPEVEGEIVRLADVSHPACQRVGDFASAEGRAEHDEGVHF